MIGGHLKLALVGCGRLAERGYLPALQRIAGIRLMAVADVNLDRCKMIAPNVPCYRSAHDLIEAGGIDAVVISTPTRFHLADASLAAKAGLPALVEKPPGVDAKQAAALMSLNPSPWIGFNRRFEPALVALRRDLPGDADLQLMFELHYRRKGWNPFDMQDDALLDLGPHLIDLARWLIGKKIERVQARSLESHHAVFEIHLERGRAAIACSTNRPYTESIIVKDSRGHVIGRYRRGGILSGILAKLNQNRENPLVDLLVRQLETFALAVRGETGATLPSAADGLAVMSTIEAVRRSAAMGGVMCSVNSIGEKLARYS
jgi:predicted dehydrogenase